MEGQRDICLGRYQDDDQITELACGHFYHLECIEKWTKQSCNVRIVEQRCELEGRPRLQHADRCVSSRVLLFMSVLHLNFHRVWHVATSMHGQDIAYNTCRLRI